MDLFIYDKTKNDLDKLYGDIITDVAETALVHEKIKHSNIEISIVFVDGNEMKSLNNKYRGINEETDVLSFPMIDDIDKINDDVDAPVILGDVIIFFGRAVAQAKEYEHSIEREIGFLTAHGVLHLLGYDHMDKSDEKIMIKKQKDILEKLDIIR